MKHDKKNQVEEHVLFNVIVHLAQCLSVISHIRFSIPAAAPSFPRN
jgi:hypothetical protein